MTDSQLNKIEKNKKVTHCYIRKHGSYYRPDCCGYTEYRHRAGVYEKQDAISKARSCRDLDILPIDHAEHNKNLCAEIKDIATRLFV